MDYILHIIILIGIYSILSVSLNLLVGYTGMISLSHAAFFGVGAYIGALMALRLSCPFLLNVLVSIIASLFLALLIGMPSLRIRDDYFVIATFAFQIIAFSIFNNLISLTGGPLGLPGIPKPTIFGISLSSDFRFLVLVVFCCIITFWISFRIINTPFGRVLRAIREDEILAKSFGKNVNEFKLIVFITGAGFAALSGILYDFYISFIDPSTFTVMESILIISMVIIGGPGNLYGSVIGAIMLISLPEILRAIGLPSSIAANIRQILYGLLLITFMLIRPKGFIGEFDLGQNYRRK